MTEPSRLRAAYVRRAHGLDGTLALELLGGDAQRLRPGLRVHTAVGAMVVGWARAAGSEVLCKLDGIDDRSSASRLAGAYLEVDRSEARSLAPGEYFHFQLVGLAVVDESGRPVGELVDVEMLPQHDIYVVRQPGGATTLVPAVRDAVRAIDLGRGTMVVALPPVDEVRDES
ncbi:MAG TPA: ribosome maturation factor RimM [Verrucomicrobiae bacterium]|nr:ribosome maturation factor RimM [Verrucomicrobiae bacterium]